jgi:hypothetical protein
MIASTTRREATATHEGTATAIDMLDWLGQRCAAADELWALGYTPESYAILRHGLSDAARLLHGARDLPAVLLAEIDALLAEAQALPAPLTRNDFSRSHAAWLERARLLSHRLRSELARSRHSRVRRTVWLSAGLIVLVIAAVLGFRAWERRVYAFAPENYFAAEYPASYAVDGQRATEWLLPDRKRGHIDLSLATRRPVHAVTIINSHNRAYMDRAIKKAIVSVFDDNRQVDRAEVTFDKVETRAAPKRVVMKGAEGTRVRILITEHHGLGGGIADVAIE